MRIQLILYPVVFATLFAAACSRADETTFKPGDMEIRMLYRPGLKSWEYYILLPGNRIVNGVPIGGLDSLDYKQTSAESPTRCGTKLSAG